MSSNSAMVRLQAEPLEGCDPVVGLALWVLQDSRRRTLGEIEELREEWLDLEPPMGHNTLRTILYHLGAAEIDWLKSVFKEEHPDNIKSLFPQDDRDETGNLARVEGEGLQSCLERMAAARQHFLNRYKGMSAEEFRSLYPITHWSGETHHISPERVLYHLVNHGAEHRGELVMIIQHFKEQNEAG